MKWPLLKVKEYKAVEYKTRTLFLCCSKPSSSSSSHSFSSPVQGRMCWWHVLHGSPAWCAYHAGVTETVKYCLFAALFWLCLYEALSVIRTFLKMFTGIIYCSSVSMRSGVFGSSCMAWQRARVEEISDSLHAYTAQQEFQSLFLMTFHSCGI